MRPSDALSRRRRQSRTLSLSQALTGPLRRFSRALARLARLSVPARPSESPRDCLSSPGLSTVRGSCSVGQADAVTLDQVGDGAADGLAVLVLELDVLLAPAGQQIGRAHV